MSERKDHIDALAIALLVGCCAFWGYQQILIKATVGEVPPLWQASLRMGGATVLLWLWCRWHGVALFGRDGTLGAGLLAGLLFAAEFAFIYVGMQYTSASRLTVFLYTNPFVVALLVPRLIPSEQLRPTQWAGLVLAFVAVALAFHEGFTQPASGPEQWLGDAMGLAAGVFWGLTTVTIRASRLATARAEKTLFYQLAVTTVVCPVLSLALGEHWSWDYSARAWGSVFLQAAVGAFATILAWMWLLRHYPATQVTPFTFQTPVYALLFGVLLLGEPLTLQLVVAVIGVAIGIVLVSWRR
jgi:drug/metabolite transporter (DMT)-like permease